jgi:hypothetical protein
MPISQTVFAQLMSLIDHDEFNRCVKRYDGDKGVKEFTCYDQFSCMIFSQLAKKRSLRDTIFTLQMMQSKLYHMGIRCNLSLNTFSNANTQRSWRIYADYAQSLILKARELYFDEKIDVKVKNNIYIIDSTTIDLCLNIYDWAKFRSTKSGIKLHTMMDIKGSIPVLIDITNAIVSDNQFIDKIEIEKNAIYTMNRGYCDFKRFSRIDEGKASFVTRLKRNIKFRRLYSQRTNQTEGLIYDQIGVLDSKQGKKEYQKKIRTIKYHDSEHNITYIFLTNNFELDALTICRLYKKRCNIELFFKWIKQNLHIESFFGQSENAVRLQIWIAICSYLMIAILRKTLNVQTELSQILHFFSNILFEQIPIKSLFPEIDYKTKMNNLYTPALQLNILMGH